MAEEEKVVPAQQLKIRGLDRKEKPGNKWVIVTILVITILSGLFFSLTSKAGKSVEKTTGQPSRNWNPFGSVEYEFRK